MEKEQQKVWDNIAEEWHEFRSMKEEKQAKHTLDFLKNKKGKILDFGSGSGRYLIPLKDVEWTLVDFSKEMIKLAKEKAKSKKIKANFAVAPMTNLPFDDETFDFAIASSSLHCLPKKEHEKAVKELYRVLKPKAQVEISVWNKESNRFKKSPKEKMIAWRDKGKRYYYLFTPKEIYDLFKKNKFKIIEKDPFNKEGMMIIFTVKKID